MKFPSGTVVTDKRAGVVYTVGDDEKAVGTVQPMGKPRNLEPGDVQMPTGVEAPGRVKSNSYWVWAALPIALLAVFVSLRIWRRRGG